MAVDTKKLFNEDLPAAMKNNPEEAKELGLVDQLFDDAAACRAGAVAYCAKLADGPSEAIGAEGHASNASAADNVRSVVRRAGRQPRCSPGCPVR